MSLTLRGDILICDWRSTDECKVLRIWYYVNLAYYRDQRDIWFVDVCSTSRWLLMICSMEDRHLSWSIRITFIQTDLMILYQTTTFFFIPISYDSYVSLWIEAICRWSPESSTSQNDIFSMMSSNVSRDSSRVRHVNNDVYYTRSSVLFSSQLFFLNRRYCIWTSFMIVSFFVQKFFWYDIIVIIKWEFFLFLIEV